MDCTTGASWFDFLLHNIQTRSDVRPVAYPTGTGLLSLGIKQPGREADSSIPCTAKLTSAATCLHGVHSDGSDLPALSLPSPVAARLHSVLIGGCVSSRASGRFGQAKSLFPLPGFEPWQGKEVLCIHLVPAPLPHRG
jgi:hypothetical protein